MKVPSTRKPQTDKLSAVTCRCQYCTNYYFLTLQQLHRSRALVVSAGTMSMPCSYNASPRSFNSLAATGVQTRTPQCNPKCPKVPVPIEAWYYNPNSEDDPQENDPALPHRFAPNQPAATELLEQLKVLTWTGLETETYQQNQFLQQIKLERGYKYDEVAVVAPATMIDYEKNIKKFFKEHLHEHEEIRLILGGGGYEDIRDFDGRWIRIHIKKGDLIILPPGMYHRFTLDDHYHVKALLLYQEEPCRIQFDRNKVTDAMDVRKEYEVSVLSRGPSMDVGSRELTSMLDGLDDYIAVLQAQQEKKESELERTKSMVTKASPHESTPPASTSEELPVTESNISFEAGTPVTVLQSEVALDGHIDHVNVVESPKHDQESASMTSGQTIRSQGCSMLE